MDRFLLGGSMKLKSKIWNKHERTQKILWLITWIIFLPIVILQVINDGLEFIIQKAIRLRNSIVYTTFKIIYKKEILESLKGADNI